MFVKVYSCEQIRKGAGHAPRPTFLCVLWVFHQQHFDKGLEIAVELLKLWNAIIDILCHNKS